MATAWAGAVPAGPDGLVGDRNVAERSDETGFHRGPFSSALGRRDARPAGWKRGDREEPISGVQTGRRRRLELGCDRGSGRRRRTREHRQR